MATKKIFRLDLFIEWLRDNLLYRIDDYSCDTCPVGEVCDEKTLEMRILCDEDNAEDFKQAIIDRFSTEVEVVEDDGFAQMIIDDVYAQAIIERFSTDVEVEE